MSKAIALFLWLGSGVAFATASSLVCLRVGAAAEVKIFTSELALADKMGLDLIAKDKDAGDFTGQAAWEKAVTDFFEKNRDDAAVQKMVQDFIVAYVTQPPERYLPGDWEMVRTIKH